jgi:hypothetical protein
LSANPFCGTPISWASGPSSHAGNAPTSSREIITELPTSFHRAVDAVRPSLSQVICASPVIVRPGSSTAVPPACRDR